MASAEEEEPEVAQRMHEQRTDRGRPCQIEKRGKREIDADCDRHQSELKKSVN
jgi:hypothetical protein